MFKNKLISLILTGVLVLSSIAVAFADDSTTGALNTTSTVTTNERSTDSNVTVQPISTKSNMVTYHTLSPLVGSSSDYKTVDSTRDGNTVFDSAITGLTVTVICAGIGEIPYIAAVVANGAKLTSLGSSILAAAQAKNITEKKIYYTVTSYKYKSNGPHTFAYKYVTKFTNQAKNETYSTSTEYYTYVI